MKRRKKQVTLRTIADELGLTIHTVSKSLRGLPGMSETTRKRVIDKARELGYRTKEQEAGLAAERIPWVYAAPRRFAMLIVEHSMFHSLQLRGVQIRLNELGHSLYPLIVPSGLAQGSEFEEWLSRNDLDFVDGLFLTAGLPEWMERALLKLQIPKVLINYPPELAEVDSVIWDVEHAIQQSMEMLYEHGHRRILYIANIDGTRGFRLRWKAFMLAVDRLGLTELVDPDMQVISTDADRTAWMESIRQKLNSGQYTAVLCAIPGVAEWVNVVADFLQLRIPNDVSLIGIENEEHMFFPEMTRPHLLIREAGERAAELMLRRISQSITAV